MSEDNKLQTYLAEHPRMIGVLFTLMLLLTQAGSAMGGAGTSTMGP